MNTDRRQYAEAEYDDSMIGADHICLSYSDWMQLVELTEADGIEISEITRILGAGPDGQGFVLDIQQYEWLESMTFNEIVTWVIDHAQEAK